MSKRTSFLFFITLLISTITLPTAEALRIGPSSIELDVSIDGSSSTTIYFNSDGVTGELVIGKEDLPFRIEPSRVNMTSGDVNIPVKLTFYGNETLEPGVYEGKVTFIAYTGGFVAVGIKIRATINLLGEAQEEEPEMPVEAETEEEPETEPESEEEEHEEETEIESEGDPENESQKNSGNPYITGGLVLGTIVTLGLTGIWLKRR